VQRRLRIDVVALRDHDHLVGVRHVRIVLQRIADVPEQQDAGAQADGQAEDHDQRVAGFVQQGAPADAEVLEFHCVS